MKEWWLQLALREKQILSVGALFILVFVIYFLFWNPLENKVNILRNQLTRNQELLAWMETTDKQIKNLEKNTKKISFEHSESLLSNVQNQLNQSELSGSLSDMREREQNVVQLHFKLISFDKLMTWLIKNTAQQGWVITQLLATPQNTPGTVSIVLELQAS